jgi:hypothetical protein
MFRPLAPVLLSAVAVALSGCPGPGPKAAGPNLVPTSTNQTNTGCDEVGTNPNQQVVITVQNTGTAPALPPSNVSVTFTNVPNPVPLTINVPIAPGGSSQVQTAIPNGCGGANCSATITVQGNTTTCIARIG